jgi:NAD-dependent deacetylase
MSHDSAVVQAAALLRQARHAVALTGAGVSTPSGIPDFRSPGSGLWESANPYVVASIIGFRLKPKAFYDWVKPLAAKAFAAEPNPAHEALAELEDAGMLAAVITQNVDGLHQKAGSKEVLELHGHIRESSCLRCQRAVPTDTLIDRFLTSGEVPRCSDCGGVMKPKVVLYGEQLPMDAVDAAMAHVRQADLMLVAGSLLEVVPVAQYPRLAHERGASIVVVNLSPTYIDPVADVVICANVAEVLPRIVQACVGG